MPEGMFDESFDTETGSDGALRFRYRLEPARKGGLRPYTRSPSMSQAQYEAAVRQRASMGPRFERWFDAGLARKLEETGYCPNGYFVLERVVGRDLGLLRGECR
ncbi:hypothetical protein MNKW57_16800 [Biformimicrobium ophioploci]|uniref:Uncharacterized protein n=2 Tax=Biformimicrobium ophioploci TaxID=3036711 RepID=A0ABQ6LZ38_9GAMM|nr:hypothetical protein MNKW57_16800 [Microbulbifer sp. NKW57]